MPYFHVRIAQNKSAEYIVQADDLRAAEVCATDAARYMEFDNKIILPLREEHSSEVLTATADKAAWSEALALADRPV